ncbi:acyl-CoA dehydrogenase family protein [Dactylosporangium sucinum]|uniref:Acyl-CoA dehydrogenase n=1 Tax=Dactylosporangium sucinum TaxID=1424081 RepID=A0A917WX21_9ACTN|nr:acyl-CoA dehydrogenase family protein [Dactylosporangium sucinum]GGM40953.1 acyl-CoA dehydrogenase [Dactylosporangium sucinum]
MSVDLRLGPQADQLRVRLRAMLAELLPGDWTTSFATDPAVQAVVAGITERLAAEGLLTLSWPKEYGGAEADVWQQTVLREEMWAHFEPRGPQYMGLNWVGPVIMEVGTPDQKARHLPGISAGRAVWCQGFSEPGAGSDLGSLRLAARPDGDEWVLNGQKIWTSYAGLAQWCFLAARTGSAAAKHEGITIFLVPMDSPGITVVPIDSMLGEQHLNEVFFDDVRVGADAVLGGVGGGWDVIRLVLKHERIGIPRYARDERLLADLAAHPGLAATGARHAFVRALVHARVARLLSYRAVAQREAGRLTDREASIARLASIQLDQEVGRLALDVSGPDALVPDPSAPGLLGHVEDVFRYARSATIASGTIEVQRMLVARSALQEDGHAS